VKKPLVLLMSLFSLCGLASCGGHGSSQPTFGPATHYTVTASSTASAGTAFQFTVTVQDASNNTVTTYSGTLHFTSTDAQAILPANSTLTNGVGNFSATLKTLGAQTITATDTINASITGVSSTITVIGPATQFSVSGPGGATTGTAIQVVVTALDSLSHEVTTYSGTVHFTSTDAKAVLPANSTLTNGTGTFSVTFNTSGSQTVTATDTVNASVTGTSNSIIVSGAATHFSVTAPASATVGTAFNVTVTALDVSNNVAATYAGTVHFTSTDAQADLPANATLPGGSNTFPASLKTTGNQTITATDTVTASITGTSSAIAVSAAAAENPVPFISLPLNPTAAAPGGAAFNMTISGTGFVSGSVVQWNGSARATTFVSESKLTAAILASDISQANTAAVTVVAPAPGGGASNVVYFETTVPTTWAGLDPPGELAVAFPPVVFAPIAIVTGDFNGDGKLDLAVVGTTSVSILLGNGDGTFQTDVQYSVGSGPVAIATGDFNGDGNLDLVVVDSGDATVSILLGNGDGTFQQSFELPGFGANPASVAVADFNGDGKLDLAVSNESSGANLGNGTVSILLGNGDGTFQPALDFAAGSNPGPIVVGDFNGDGKLDLVVADDGTSPPNTAVNIFLGNGDGTFQAAQAYTVGTNPSSLVAADFNGDGKLDLAVANYDTNNVSILLGNGDGTFQSATNFSAGSGPSSVVVADLNGDGKLDMAVANLGTNAVNLLLGNGDGTFQAAVPYASDKFLLSLAVGDFNGDGRLDLAAAESKGEAEVLLQPTIVSGTNASISPAFLGFSCSSNRGFCFCKNDGSTVTLSNFGTAALTIDNTSITGPFSQTNNCGATLQPGQSCAFAVSWNRVTGAGTLTVQDNASDSPQSVSLSAIDSCGDGQMVVEGQAAETAGCREK